MVTTWSPDEDKIIVKHAKDKAHKSKAEAWAAASKEIGESLGIVRSSGAVSQHFYVAKLDKKKNTITDIIVVKPVKGNIMVPQNMALEVATMAIGKLNPAQRLSLVEKMLNHDL